jgi:4a-hydroxytetrahydrobiopterin dehydratase
MSSLEIKNCDPCSEGTLPLSEKEESEFLSQLKGWSLDRKRVHQLRKLFQFKSFPAAIEFVDNVAKLAEKEGHHPDFYIAFRHVSIMLWTKKIAGLSENDFIIAAKINLLYDDEI